MSRWDLRDLAERATPDSSTPSPQKLIVNGSWIAIVGIIGGGVGWLIEGFGAWAIFGTVLLAIGAGTVVLGALLTRSSRYR